MATPPALGEPLLPGRRPGGCAWDSLGCPEPQTHTLRQNEAVYSGDGRALGAGAPRSEAGKQHRQNRAPRGVRLLPPQTSSPLGARCQCRISGQGCPGTEGPRDPHLPDGVCELPPDQGRAGARDQGGKGHQPGLVRRGASVWGWPVDKERGGVLGEASLAREQPGGRWTEGKRLRARAGMGAHRQLSGPVCPRAGVAGGGAGPERAGSCQPARAKGRTVGKAHTYRSLQGRQITSLQD